MNEQTTVQLNVALENGLFLRRDEQGLSLVSEDQILRGDFTKMIPRVKPGNISKELLVKAAKIKDADHELRAVDATAGLGEDSLLLAAAGFEVTLFERNGGIYGRRRNGSGKSSDGCSD